MKYLVDRVACLVPAAWWLALYLNVDITGVVNFVRGVILERYVLVRHGIRRVIPGVLDALHLHAVTHSGNKIIDFNGL